MSLQSALNQDAINMLPKTKAAIEAAESFEANQMECLAIRVICDTYPCLVDKNQNQLKDFDFEMINRFKHYNWM